MLGYDRTVRGAMRDLFLAVAHLNPERLAKWVDRDLTHTNVPPALRRPISYVRLSALDEAARAAADFERRYIEEI